MKSKLDEFSAYSGLQVNYLNCQIFFARAPTAVEEDLLSSLGFQIGRVSVKYLEVPLISSRLSISDCAHILDKVKQRISSWANRFLSFDGRALLIKSILFHLQVYWSSICIFPQVVVNDVENLCRNFILSGQYENNCLCPVAWLDICVPRREGGLAFKKSKA